MVNKKNILVTGAGSGLGKYFYEYFNAVGFFRESNIDEVTQQSASCGFDIIIHAAFNAKFNLDSENLLSFYQDNIILTEKLLKIPHKKFIFISSVDVYEKNNLLHKEDEIIKIGTQSLYGTFKLLAESIVQKKSENYLILRCSALLGKYAKPNCLTKMLTQDNVKLTLHGESQFNYILYEDVVNFINIALEKNLNDIYNLVSTNNIKLIDVANHFNLKINFGNYIYNIGLINNNKIINICKSFLDHSLNKIKSFINCNIKQGVTL